MALLKKIKASTLMETLVATVLIVIIFMISSMLLNSMFSNAVEGRNAKITGRLQQLKYEYHHKGFELPYYEDFEAWELSVASEIEEGITFVVLKAENPESKQIYTERMVHYD